MDDSSFKLVKTINFSVLPPLLTREQFGSYIGTTSDTVRGWIQTHTIPTAKIGRQRLVNLALLAEDLKNGKTEFKPGDYMTSNAGNKSN